MDIKLLVIVFTVGFFAAMWRVLKHPIYGVFSKTSNKQLRKDKEIRNCSDSE